MTDGGHDKPYYCFYCLDYFLSPTALKKHEVCCKSNNVVKVEMQARDNSVKYEKFHTKMRVPLVAYTYFESFIKPSDTCQSDPSAPYTIQYQHRTPSSFCYCIKYYDDHFYCSKLTTFTIEKDDDDVVEAFVASFESHVKDIYDMSFKFLKKMI